MKFYIVNGNILEILNYYHFINIDKGENQSNIIVSFPIFTAT